MKVTFITGNENKVKTLQKFLGHPVDHKKVNLDELQSLDLREIVEHKVKRAYEIVGSPVLVEDISFEISALGHLPGPFIKWFIDEVGFEKLCRLADPDGGRRAVAKVCYGYYDGRRHEFFEGELTGSMPEHPRGSDGFGWNCVFIPKGQSKTDAEMNDKEMERYSLRTTTVYPELRKFLEMIDNK